LERFNLKKLKEQYRVEVSNRFAALEDENTEGNDKEYNNFSQRESRL
jgi:hypothetical protein